MKYKIDNEDYNVIIVKKNNKNTYIRIKEDLNIYVTTSYFVTSNQIKKMLDENYSYLKKTIDKCKKKNEKQEKFYYLGKPYDIIWLDIKDIQILGNNLYVKNKENLEKWYQKEIKKVFLEHLDKIYTIFEENIPYPNLRIRKMKTRWGVCNKKLKTITLNSELMRYSLDKLDYVIIHELSHFIHFDHSKEFWLLVSKYCPNYKMIRKELRE